MHPPELRGTLMSYAAPSELSCTLLSYARTLSELRYALRALLRPKSYAAPYRLAAPF